MNMLKEIVEKGHYCFVEKVDSWQDAIRQSYAPLLKDNTVENEYVEAVIECVNKYGPYIVIVPGIAMPHSTEGAAGCNGTAISFMKVEEEVDFDPDEVTYFISASHPSITKQHNMAHWRKMLYAAMARNATNPTDFYHLPPDRTITIAAYIDL